MKKEQVCIYREQAPTWQTGLCLPFSFGKRFFHSTAFFMIFAVLLAIPFLLTGCSPSAAPAKTPDTLVDRPDCYHIIFAANDNVAVKDIPSDLSLLRERIRILAGDSEAFWSENGNGAETWIPKVCFDGLPVERVLKSYVVCPGRLYGTLNASAGLYIQNVNNPNSSEDVLAIRRDDISEILLEDGVIPPAAVEKQPPAVSVPHIKLTLSDSFLTMNADRIRNMENGFFLTTDCRDQLGLKFYTIPGTDGKTFYLSDKYFNPTLTKLLFYNLTHENLHAAFSYSLDIKQLLIPESESTETAWGKNQVSLSALEEEPVLVPIQFFSSTEEEGELEAVLKRRLDALQKPYAFSGIAGDTDELGTNTPSLYAVSVSPQLGKVALPLLLSMKVSDYSSACSLRTGLRLLSIYPEIAKLSAGSDEDGKAFLSLEMKGVEANQRLKDFVSAAAEGDRRIHLTIDGFPLLCWSLPEGIDSDEYFEKNGELVFREYSLTGSELLTPGNVWIPALIEAAFLERLPASASGGKNVLTDEDLQAVEAQLAVTIRKLWDDATVRVQSVNPYEVLVNLNLPLDDRLPERAIQLSREIFEALHFPLSPYEKLFIRFCREDELNYERARIFFTKQFGNIENSNEDGMIEMSGLFTNGRLEKYTEAFQALLESDPFYDTLHASEKMRYSWQ